MAEILPNFCVNLKPEGHSIGVVSPRTENPTAFAHAERCERPEPKGPVDLFSSVTNDVEDDILACAY